jgi:hypothetical protein
MDVQLHVFWHSTLDEVGYNFNAPAVLYPAKDPTVPNGAGPGAATRKITCFFREFNFESSIVRATASSFGCQRYWNKTRTKWQAEVRCSCIRIGSVATSCWNVLSGNSSRSYKPRSKVARRHTKEYQHIAGRIWTKDIENKSCPTQS